MDWTVDVPDRPASVTRIPFPGRVFAILLALGIVALILSLPFPPRLSLLLSGIVVLIGTVGTGMLLARSIGLRVSGVESWPKWRPGWPHLLSLIGRPALVGAGLGAVILLAIRFLFVPILPPLQSSFASEAAVAVWKRIVIAFDSAILEELMFRLFLLSLLAWLLSRIWRNAEGMPRRGAFWAVNILVALGFGLAHLPRWSAITPLTLPVVAIVVFLNGIGGLTFGYLYFTQGIEAAMLAHFAADLVLHVVGPGYLSYGH